MLDLTRRDWRMVASGVVGAVIANQGLVQFDKHYVRTTMTYIFETGQMVSFSFDGSRCRELQDALSDPGVVINTTAPWGEKFSVKTIDCGRWNRTPREPP